MLLTYLTSNFDSYTDDTFLSSNNNNISVAASDQDKDLQKRKTGTYMSKIKEFVFSKKVILPIQPSLFFNKWKTKLTITHKQKLAIQYHVDEKN